MSRENILLLRAAFEAFNSADLQRILTLVHPEFEGSVPGELSAEPDSYRGHEGLSRYFETFWEVMEDIHFETERVWDAGEHVIAHFRLTAKGRQTAIPVEQRAFLLWTVRDHKVALARAYPSLEQALESIGLQRQDVFEIS